ncbi:MAG: DsbA family protein, partial [Patescibacteria group bacterium]
PVARKAAEASECAADQGKFWEYTDEVFANQKGLTLDGLSTIAGTVGLNVNEFDSCLSSGKYASKVETDFQEGVSMGVRGTPGSFINGQTIPGAVPFEQMQAAIEKLLQ